MRSRYLQILAYILLIPIFIFLIGIVNDCGRRPAIPVEGFSKGDTIDMAVLYIPGGYYSHDDSISGINHEIGEKFSEATGRPIKFWPVADSAKALGMLREGAFDILASLPLDNTLKKNFKVSESVFLDRLVLVQMKDSVTGEVPVASSLDLDGKTVYVAEASSAAMRMKNLAGEIGGEITVEEVPGLSDELICLKVAEGSFPLAVVNENIARKLSEHYPLLDYDNSVSFTQFQVWVFNPTDTILPSLFNHWLENNPSLPLR